METFHNRLVYVTFLCVFCFAWSTQAKTRIIVPTPNVLELRQAAEKCEKETGIPASHLKKIIEKSLPKDKDNNQFFFCVATSTGLTDENGRLGLEKLSTFQVLDGKPEDYINALKDCAKGVKDSPVDTLLAAADCLHENYLFAPAAQQ